MWFVVPPLSPCSSGLTWLHPEDRANSLWRSVGETEVLLPVHGGQQGAVVFCLFHLTGKKICGANPLILAESLSIYLLNIWKTFESTVGFCFAPNETTSTPCCLPCCYNLPAFSAIYHAILWHLYALSTPLFEGINYSQIWADLRQVLFPIPC